MRFKLLCIYAYIDFDVVNKLECNKCQKSNGVGVQCFIEMLEKHV